MAVWLLQAFEQYSKSDMPVIQTSNALPEPFVDYSPGFLGAIAHYILDNAQCFWHDGPVVALEFPVYAASYISTVLLFDRVPEYDRGWQRDKPDEFGAFSWIGIGIRVLHG